MPEDYSQRFDFHSALETDSLASEPEPKQPHEDVEKSVSPDVDMQTELRPTSPGRIKVRESDGKTNKHVESDKPAAMSYISIPRSLALLARSCVPTATTLQDAVATYLYVVTGRVADVPLKIEKLAENYRDDIGISDLQREVIELRLQVKSMKEADGKVQRAISDLELALVWLLGEKMGFSVNVTASPDKMDFLFPEADALLKRLREQSLLREKEAKLVEGREIYKAKYERGGKK